MILIPALQSQSFEIKGFIRDSLEKAPLPGASVSIAGSTHGTVTNQNGLFKLKSESSDVYLVFSYLGYTTMQKHLKLQNDTTLQIFLQPLSIQSEEVIITSNESQTENANIGKIKLINKNIEFMPSIGGERDYLKMLMLTPGIQSVSEGSSGLYVRGGEAGQNLILLDDLPLYNPNHLLGFFPVFNASVIKNVEISKGIDDAETGGKLSSVVRVNMKSGDEKEMKAECNMGLLSSSVTLSGPVTDKTRYLLSARRTYLQLVQDVILKKISNDKFIQNTRYSFQDYYAKINHDISKNDRLGLLFYGGFDDYNLKNKSIGFNNKMKWNNLGTSLNWTHSFNNGLYNRFSAGYTTYHHQMDASFDAYEFGLGSNIEDYYIKNVISFDGWTYHYFKAGVEYIRHLNKPGHVNAEAQSVSYQNNEIYHSNEISAFLNDEINIGSAVILNAGLRFTGYEHVGPYERVLANDLNLIEDTLQYAAGEKIYTTYFFEPRLSANWKINKNQSLKLGFARVTQPIHLIPVGGVSLPADIWFSSTAFAPPATSWQYSLGYYRLLKPLGLEASAEMFYKQMNGLLERKKSILNNFDNTGLETSFTSGTGTARGIEVNLSKPSGKLNGWISYTLSKSVRQFTELNNGNTFVSKFDRPHDLSIVGNYVFNDAWSVSGIFVYASGSAMTLPAGRYVIQGVIMNDYTGVNAYRLPDYHRLDVSLNYRNKKSWGEYIWNFSIYNVYNRSNPYYMFFDTEADIDSYYLKVEPEQISLYPMLPSISLILKF